MGQHSSTIRSSKNRYKMSNRKSKNKKWKSGMETVTSNSSICRCIYDRLVSNFGNTKSFWKLGTSSQAYRYRSSRVTCNFIRSRILRLNHYTSLHNSLYRQPSSQENSRVGWKKAMAEGNNARNMGLLQLVRYQNSRISMGSINPKPSRRTNENVRRIRLVTEPSVIQFIKQEMGTIYHRPYGKYSNKKSKMLQQPFLWPRIRSSRLLHPELEQ